MKFSRVILITTIVLTACDDSRVFERNVDFETRSWRVADKPQFEFEIDRTDVPYNLYCNFRNEEAFPFARFFYKYYLLDSTGIELSNALSGEFLFDAKTGKPFGQSGLGDIYYHQFLVLKDFRFNRPGKYVMRLEQFSTDDTLEGILSAGVRVERADID